MFRLQFADSVPPSGIGVARWQRLGRFSPRTSRRVDHTTKIRWQKGFRHPNMLHFATDGNTGDESSHNRFEEIAPPDRIVFFTV